MITNQQILDVLSDLKKPDFHVHISSAWYSSHAILNAFGLKAEDAPEVHCVRVSLTSGMLELHPNEKDKIEIRCYCCFSGDPEKGTYSLADLKDAIVALKDHYCPPWPG